MSAKDGKAGREGVCIARSHAVTRDNKDEHKERVPAVSELLRKCGSAEDTVREGSLGGAVQVGVFCSLDVALDGSYGGALLACVSVFPPQCFIEEFNIITI